MCGRNNQGGLFNAFGGNSCTWLFVLLLLSCFCSGGLTGGNRSGYGNGCCGNNNCGGCGCNNDLCD